MRERAYKDRADVRTSTPGVYKRGNRYSVIYRDPQGRQRRQSARTLAEARELKATLTADVKRGEYRALSRVTFSEYAQEWITTYQGRTSRGIRPETLADYRRDLGIGEDGELLGGGAVAHFGRLRLAEVEPRDVKGYAATLAERGLSAGSVRNALAPVRALLATAFEEGLIRSNPAAGLRINHRVESNEAEPTAKALTEQELQRLLGETPQEFKLLIEFLAHTGLRIGEALALRWQDIDHGHRRVHVRRRLYRGNFAPPKSRYGLRAVPLTEGMARELWEHRKLACNPGDDAPVFASRSGEYLQHSNLFKRVLKPAAKRAGVPWAGFHTLRHTCATMLFRNGLNAKQVQVWLGHHSPAFTLATYVHLLPDDLPDPAFLDSLTAGNRRVTHPTETHRDRVVLEAVGNA